MTPAQFLSALDDHELWLSSRGIKGKKAQLEGAKISDVTVEGKDLSHVNLAGTKFTNVSFRDTKLSFAHVAHCQWVGVDVTGCKLTCASFREGVLLQCVFDDSDLYFATLTDAIFKSCSFVNTLLKNVNLTNAKLFNSTLDQAYLCDTILTGSTIRDPNSASVHHLSTRPIKR